MDSGDHTVPVSGPKGVEPVEKEEVFPELGSEEKAMQRASRVIELGPPIFAGTESSPTAAMAVMSGNTSINGDSSMGQVGLSSGWDLPTDVITRSEDKTQSQSSGEVENAQSEPGNHISAPVPPRRTSSLNHHGRLERSREPEKRDKVDGVDPEANEKLAVLPDNTVEAGGREIGLRLGGSGPAKQEAESGSPTSGGAEKGTTALSRNKHMGEERSALLNLPPPLPFHLSVDNLWVGIPTKGAAS
jgi:hypothetical protein